MKARSADRVAGLRLPSGKRGMLFLLSGLSLMVYRVAVTTQMDVPEMARKRDKLSTHTTLRGKEKETVSAEKFKIDPKRHKQLENSIDNVNKDDQAAMKAIGFGERVRSLRTALNMSQESVAKQVGHSRSGVAQWEAGISIPRLRKMNVLANVLRTTPHFLAHGIEDGPTLVQPDMSDIGCYLVPEVVFGESPTDTTTTLQWGLPTQWLRHDLNISDVTKAILYRIEAAYAASRYEHGDTLVIDTGYHRLSPGGTFLYWDGVGPAVADISVIPVPVKNKVLAKIRNMDGTEFEADVDALVIIGRVRGLWRKS